MLVAIAWYLVRHPTIRTSGTAPAPPLAQADQLFGVRVDGKYGFIDRTGVTVIPPRYAGAGMRFSEGLVAACDADWRWGYIDQHGEWIVPPRFAMAYGFSEGLAVVQEEFVAPWGFIDRTGAWILPPQFETAEPFRNGRALVGRLTMLGRVKARLDADEASDWRWRAIDRAGNDLGRVHRTYEPEFGVDGLRQFWSGRLIGFEDRSGVQVIAPLFQETTGFSEGLAAAHFPGQAWGYIDRTGAWAISPRFGWSNPFYDGLAEVTMNGKAGYIDRTGQWVWEPTE